MTLGSLNSVLHNSPYLVPDDPKSVALAQRFTSNELDFRGRLTVVRDHLVSQKLAGDVRSWQTAREIYESNKIEGLGPNLSRTNDILGTYHISTDTDPLQTHLLLQSMAQDPDLLAVVGLEGARVLAQRLSSDNAVGRTITEVDLRTLHGIICHGESYAGRYKHWHVRIGGETAHEPLLPIDVPGAMNEYMTWFRTAGGSAVLRAAVAHAWLTHIHPFEDGNGRLARLVANYVLAGAGLPPVIIKHASERSQYLDALAQSDIGGDILPFADLLEKALRRYLREIERPHFLRAVFRQELQRRGDSLYEWWRAEFADFFARLTAELRLSRLEVSNTTLVDNESFALLQECDSTGNTWIALVRDRLGREVLLWLGYSRANMSTFGGSERYPSIYFSVTSQPYDTKPYRKARSDEVGGLTEVRVSPDLPTKVYVELCDQRVRVGGVDEGAAEIADKLRQAFLGGTVPFGRLKRGQAAD